MSIRDELQQYIIKNYIKGDVPEGFDSHFDLIGSGILTSLALINLLNHLETQYEIEFGEDDIIPEHFESIDVIEQFIRRTQAVNSKLAQESA